jgi:uncharacterized membrane protein YccC
LLSGYLLFPQWESTLLPPQIAEALRAEAAFLRALGDAIVGKKERPISEFRRDAAIAVSNASTAGQRLLSEPPARRGDVEASLASVNYCRRILHSLAALSDYPTRGAVRHQSEELIEFFQVLAESLENLAASLVNRTEPKPLSTLTTLLDRLESFLPSAANDRETGPGSPDETMQESAISASLFYHLKNAVDLTLKLREVISRLLGFGTPGQTAEMALSMRR